MITRPMSMPNRGVAVFMPALSAVITASGTSNALVGYSLYLLISALTLDALRAFRVFASHMNFTRAAEELHISQPALHVKINKLGSALGVILYERHGRGLVLTAAGASVARFATTLERDIAAFVGSLAPGDAAQPLVLAAGEGAHLYVLAGAIRRLLADGDDLRLLTTNTDETIAAVHSGRADLGVAVIDGQPRGLDAVAIATYAQVLVMPAGHPLARARSLSVTDLAGVALVVPPPDRPHRQGLDQALRRAHVTASVAIETEGWAQMLHFVSLGVGLAVVNGCVVPGGDLVARPVSDLPTVTYSAVYQPARANDPQVRSLLDVLQASAP